LQENQQHNDGQNQHALEKQPQHSDARLRGLFGLAELIRLWPFLCHLATQQEPEKSGTDLPFFE
jgi:hypothetical protein